MLHFQALGTGFSQFAQPVFQRCINIIQTQQLAKVLINSIYNTLESTIYILIFNFNCSFVLSILQGWLMLLNILFSM